MGYQLIDLRLDPRITERAQYVVSVIDVYIEVSTDMFMAPAKS